MRPRDTERLTFRSWQVEDEALANGLWGDPRVTEFIDARAQLDVGAVRQRLRLELERESEHGIQYWPIFLRETGEHVGCCGLRPYDLLRQRLEFGCLLRVDHWGKQFATEAGRSVVVHAFDALHVAALFAGHHPRNLGSRRMLEKLGFRYTHDELYEPTGLQHPSYLLARPEYQANYQTG